MGMADEHDDDDAQTGKVTWVITPQGASRLRAELKHLVTVERPKVTREVSDAAAQGDRSENAEYIYGKRRLREIDRRLQFLHKRLERLSVVDPAAQTDKTRVYFGATVTLEGEDSAVTYQLVGPDEIDLKQGRISVDSPVGRALLGRSKGDEVTVRRPRGDLELTIVDIAYR